MRAMKIEELDDGECSRDEEEKCQRQIVSIDAKRGWLEQVLGSCSTPHSCIMLQQPIKKRKKLLNINIEMLL